MGANAHPTVVPENSDEYRSLKQRLRSEDGVELVDARGTRRPFMIKVTDNVTLHRDTLEAIDDAGLDVIGVGNSRGRMYIHVKER